MIDLRKLLSTEDLGELEFKQIIITLPNVT